MSDVTIYGPTISPFVRKAVVLAIEKGIDFENVPVNPRELPAELAPHTPLGKIPFANVQGHWVADSSVISELLDELYPDPAFYPSGTWERARARWIEEYVDGAMIPSIGPRVVFQRLLRPLLTGEAPDETIVQDALNNDLPRYASYLDGQLEGRDFYVGDALSIADVTVASFQATLAHVDVVLDAATYPNLARHREAMWSRPSFARLREGEVAFLDQMKQAAAAGA